MSDLPAKIHMVENDPDHLLLVIRGEHVVNGSWNLKRDAEGLYIPNLIHKKKVQLLSDWTLREGEGYQECLDRFRNQMEDS